MRKFRFQNYFNCFFNQKRNARSKSVLLVERRVEITSIMCGVRWYMNNHDEDINMPSCPHCHAHGKNWKLNIYTGRIYDKNSYIGQISKKEFHNMWCQKEFCDAVLRERKWYNENYYDKNPVRYPKLPPLPKLVLRRKK